MSQGVPFIRRVGPLVAARFASALITLSIPLVLARMLNLPDYGTYKQLFLVFQTLYFIVPFGMPASLYFFVPRTSEERPFFSQTLLYLFFAGAFSTLLIVGVTPLLGQLFSNPEMGTFRWSIALYTGAMIASCPFETSLTSRGRTKSAALVYLISDSLRACAMVVPVVLGWGLAGLMVANVAFALVRMVVSWIVMLGGSRGPWWDRASLRAQVAYALPFGAAMALAIPQQYLHQYVVSGAVSPELFALYAVGCFQLPIVDLLYTPTSEVLMVRLAELDREGKPEQGAWTFREASGKLAFVFVPAAIFLFAAAPEFIGALFGSKFLPAVPLFRITVLGVVLATLPLDGALRARNETRHIFLSYLVKAVVTVPLVLIGVKVFGLLGGVVSWTLAEVIGKAMLVVRLRRALSSPGHPRRLRELLPIRELGQAGLAAVVSGVAVWLLRWGTESVWAGLPGGFLYRALPLAAATGVFGIGYLAVLGATGVRPAAVLAALRRRQVVSEGRSMVT